MCLKTGEQTEIVRKQIDESPYPSVICGDFNAVPNSYTYFKIKGDRQDVFLSKSFGIGKSYDALALLYGSTISCPIIILTLTNFKW